jgi:hypothetical protein
MGFASLNPSHELRRAVLGAPQRMMFSTVLVAILEGAQESARASG